MYRSSPVSESQGRRPEALTTPEAEVLARALLQAPLEELGCLQLSKPSEMTTVKECRKAGHH